MRQFLWRTTRIWRGGRWTPNKPNRRLPAVVQYPIVLIFLMDLIDHYTRSGLISEPTRHFRPCYGCGERFHPDDMHTIDIEKCGEHDTAEVCDECMEKTKTPSHYETLETGRKRRVFDDLTFFRESKSAPTGANEIVHEMNKEASDPLGDATCSD